MSDELWNKITDMFIEQMFIDTAELYEESGVGEAVWFRIEGDDEFTWREGRLMNDGFAGWIVIDVTTGKIANDIIAENGIVSREDYPVIPIMPT